MSEHLKIHGRILLIGMNRIHYPDGRITLLNLGSTVANNLQNKSFKEQIRVKERDVKCQSGRILKSYSNHPFYLSSQ